MGFFDDLKRAGSDTLSKAKDMTAIAKLNMSINEEERALEKLFGQLGRVCFERLQQDPPEELAEQVEAILQKQQTIQEYRENLKALKGIVPCPQCGADLEPDAEFCTVCGYRRYPQSAVPVAPPPQQDTCVCPACGQAVPHKAFCMKCGAKLPEKTPAPADAAPAVPAAAASPAAPAAQTAPADAASPAVPAAQTGAVDAASAAPAGFAAQVAAAAASAAAFPAAGQAPQE